MINLARATIATGVALVCFAGAILVFWVQPKSSGMSAGSTWAEFQGGSISGIVVFSTAWVSIVAILTAFALVSVGYRGRTVRWITTVFWLLLCAAVAILLTYLPFVAVELALEKVVEAPLRQRSEMLSIFRAWWGSGTFTLVISLVVGGVASHQNMIRSRPARELAEEPGHDRATAPE